MILRLRTGVLLTAAAAAGLALAWVFGLPELAVLAVFVWSALVMTAVWLAVRGRPPAVQALVNPPAVSRGEPARLEFTFSSPDGASRSAPTRVFGRLGTAGDGIVAVAGPNRDTPTVVGIDLPTPDRGLVRVGPLSTTSRDPLGWWRRDRDVDAAPALIVRPRIHPLGGWPGAGGYLPAPGRRTGRFPLGADAGEDLVGLRPYVTGDDLRRIHWRTSARRNEPHVVQVDPPVQAPAVTVVLDQHPACGVDEFERAVEVCASVLAAAASAGRSIRLVGTDFGADTIDSGPLGPTAGTDLIDMLATVTTQPAANLVATLDSLDLGSSTTVVCSGSADPLPPEAADSVALLVRCNASAGGSPGSVPVVTWDGSRTLGDEWEAMQLSAPGAAL